MAFIKHTWLPAALVLGLSATPCTAETIDIINGARALPSPFTGSFGPIGDQPGSVIAGGVDSFDWQIVPPCAPCPAGSAFGTDPTQSDSDRHGTAALAGARYDAGVVDVNRSAASVVSAGPSLALLALGSGLILTTVLLLTGLTGGAARSRRVSRR